MILPSVTITNQTNGELQFGQIQSKELWSSDPSLPCTLKQGGDLQIIGVQEPISPERGASLSVFFSSLEMNSGMIYLDVPVVGRPTVTGEGQFDFSISSEGNRYVIRILPK